MQRREFVGALAALFAGVVLPEPVRDQIMVHDAMRWDDGDAIFGGARGGGKRDAFVTYMRHYHQYMVQRPSGLYVLKGIRAPA